MSDIDEFRVACSKFRIWLYDTSCTCDNQSVDQCLSNSHGRHPRLTNLNPGLIPSFFLPFRQWKWANIGQYSSCSVITLNFMITRRTRDYFCVTLIIYLVIWAVMCRQYSYYLAWPIRYKTYSTFYQVHQQWDMFIMIIKIHVYHALYCYIYECLS